jgi:coproporphyrinogen III oxidase
MTTDSKKYLKSMTKEVIANRFKELQEYIVQKLTVLDGKQSFHSDVWNRSEGGGGITKTIVNGRIIEKGGVAFSEVFGPVTPVMKKQLDLDGESFFACGVSIVLHPNHPFVPIIHMNVRYFELDNGTYWFGGGIDLTPHYINEEDASLFHNGLKNVCDKYHIDFYKTFKENADNYFFIPHRNETRGIGGIFFDHQKDTDSISKESLFSFCIELGETFPELYTQQVERNSAKSFTDKHIEWRNHRRGRYVEFNLVNDKGTKFGLFSGGRTESILMSLPPLANWTYCYDIPVNSDEDKTQKRLIKGYKWLTVN